MSILDALRAATSEQHEALHTHPALVRLTAPDIDKPYYIHVLKKFYGFYLPLEARYAAAGHFRETLPDRDVTACLEADLRKQGIDPASLPVFSEEVSPFTLEESVGYLYLREGSNLGGRYISKQLERNLSLAPGTDNRFFNGHGDDTGKAWKKFLGAISLMDQTADKDEIAKYARKLFSDLSEWLY